MEAWVQMLDLSK